MGAWVPLTKLGRLVNDGKINSVEEIYVHSLAIKEFEIVDHFFQPGTLKDEVLKIHPVQKMTSAGQTNRFVCYVLVGDQNGHIGLGSKCSKEVATAIRGGIISAKMNLIPVRRGYWGNRIGQPHTMPMKVRQVRLRPCAIDPRTSWKWCRWLDDPQEDDEFRRSRGRLLLLLRAHEDEGQLHEGDLRGSPSQLWLLDTRLVEAHGVREASVPGVHRLPCTIEVRTRLLSIAIAVSVWCNGSLVVRS